ncbi:hypothetical protein DY000_02033392 [Brassica cretica]|uniref:Uncharacterized protein n=1 Tax=Brassica cretica TaxID=69181 RepID=A0ABQ7DHF9_BRACR|nr:hypothetical protein DY000_02033392 [Brassica cretica]
MHLSKDTTLKPEIFQLPHFEILQGSSALLHIYLFPLPQHSPSPKSFFPPCSLTPFSASAAVKDTPVTQASDSTGIPVLISYVSNELNVTDSLRVVSFGLN